MRVLLLAILSGTVLSFAPSTIIKTKPSLVTLFAATSIPPGGKRDGFSDKPIYERKSTTPIADRKVSWIEKNMMEDVMLEPDYFLTWALALLGGLIIWYHPCK